MRVRERRSEPSKNAGYMTCVCGWVCVWVGGWVGVCVCVCMCLCLWVCARVHHFDKLTNWGSPMTRVCVCARARVHHLDKLDELGVTHDINNLLALGADRTELDDVAYHLLERLEGP